ncbi:tRNA preQ1(34) S-adenosylmethionine ribosyltransferase-isomerase QueA [Bacteroides sp. 519]|uniref:tRNA preQ1(34) S-adenosylmethionine ribosyltransferase-isomerase QueA n=1 Tax=Bacteroides sp. 519 TaxID=2302937 RepID=UPI0013D7863E|nr:tRNA preQ1(34) S-adenosylmethionine ribosyltransferase-isomerase QueA [Bacteroides sp. 519]NDV57552.1 tRNA preQ1(34) S-adenosylmethionine ribosyltransferase-isomerase QueA [Bacteroides sp. 519]
MKLSQFKFKLPEEKIALHPTKYRDESRLMVVHRKTGKVEHKIFKDILEYFNEDDVFVFNDTKVFPARLYGNKEKTGARIEVFLLRELNEELRLWDVLVDPARKIRIGNKLYFGDDDSMVAEVIDNTTSRGRTLRFLYDGPHDEFKKALYALGETPLPRTIINRPVEPEDADRFQSIFARNEGAVTAPTANLHFSRELLKRLEIKGINFAYVTLHAGLGNFRDIDVEDLTKHKMDSEQMTVTPEAVSIINNAKDIHKNVCAVGTTVMRAIESTVSTDGHLKSYEGWTNKFIFPPYDFTVANSMISNFHMPLSTLLMITAAFGGYDLIMDSYNTALKEDYRFGTYGDAMLIVD